MPVQVGVTPVEQAASIEFESWFAAEIKQEPLFESSGAASAAHDQSAGSGRKRRAPPKPPASVEFRTVEAIPAVASEAATATVAARAASRIQAVVGWSTIRAAAASIPGRAAREAPVGVPFGACICWLGGGGGNCRGCDVAWRSRDAFTSSSRPYC